MSLKIILIVVGSLVMLLVLGGILKHKHYKKHFAEHLEKRSNWVAKKITKKLDLNEVQQGYLEQVRSVLVAHANDLHHSKKASKEKFTQLMNQNIITEMEIANVIAEQEALLLSLKEQAIPRVVAFHQSLDPEQKEKIKEKVNKCSHE